MSALREQFEVAATQAQSLSSRPNNAALLDLYALYKQGSAGDATGKRPGMTKMVARAKFDAWSKRKGMDAEDAMAEYVALVERLKG